MKNRRGVSFLLCICITVAGFCDGCGKKDSGLTKEQIESYDHSFSNISGAEDVIETLTYDEEGYIVCDDYVYVSTETAALRAEPDDETESVVTLYYGDKLYRTGRNDDGWVRVFYEGENLYIAKNSITEYTIDLDTEFQYTLASLNIVETSRQYYSYDNLCDNLSSIKEQFPDVVTLNVIGNSADNRAIYEVVIGNPEADKSILVVAGTEGCEYMTSMFAAKLCEYYAHVASEGIYDGYLYSELLEDCAIHIIPMANPDGVSISQYYMNAVRNSGFAQNINAWFERDQSNGGTSLSLDNYLMFYYANARGVDLSLNFAYNWDEAESTKYAANKGYKGDSEASENETKDIVKIINSIEPELVINLRTSGDSISYDFGADASVKAAALGYADILSNVFTYTLDASALGKTAYGSLEGYASVELGIPAVRVNIGSGDAPLSLTEYNSIWNSGRESLIAIIQNILNN